MRLSNRAVVVRYGFALLAVAVAVLVRLALDPWLGDAMPFLLPCLAVVAVAWHGGFGPSIFALLVGAVASMYLFMQPRYSLFASAAERQILVVGFLFLGVTIGLFSERLRMARRRAEAQAEEAMRQKQELEREVGRRRQLEDELHERARLLAEVDRHKDEFLAMLGHELRNPLAPIRNALHILRLLESPEPAAQQARDLIARQVEQLTRLVDDLLDVSRIRRGKIRLATEPVDLADVLSRAIESARPLIEANRHLLNVALPSGPVRVVADPTRLEQVFANLLNNAAKYTERGGTIDVALAAAGAEVVVHVRDTGFGIPAAVLPHIFELFTQGDRTLDRAQGGLGIGLTLVKTLVELHGGSVTARSDGPGQGSEFVVRLPVTAQPAEPPSAGPGPPPPASAGAPAPLHVLVVDDNQDAAESLASLLRLWGHEVRTAHDAVSGLKAARSYGPQAVFLDIGLPGLDGYAVARQLRVEFGPGVRLVALTGFGQDEDRKKALQAGFDAHLVKPADPEAVRGVLDPPARPGT